ncbi:MAG: hypothetical protein K2F78_04880 [Muribaculaceae bacterium]|nr:hypothetical protein [Muribaculaceae bacterium]
MKKIISLMLLTLPLLGLVACHDENDLPDVDFNFTIENATRADGYLYIVQGETMEISSIEIVNKDSGKPAIITAANFYWDYYYIGSAIEPPYAFSIETSEDTPLGDHVLQVESPLYAEGKTAATSVVTFRVRVVADASDIPSGGEQAFVVHPSTATTADN